MPLLVRPLSTGNYQIVAGERRWRAAKIAGLAEVPVVVRDDLSDEQVMQVALIENLQRENLNPIEEAQGYKELIEKYNMTQDQLSKALGKARSLHCQQSWSADSSGRRARLACRWKALSRALQGAQDDKGFCADDRDCSQSC